MKASERETLRRRYAGALARDASLEGAALARQRFLHEREEPAQAFPRVPRDPEALPVAGWAKPLMAILRTDYLILGFFALLIGRYVASR